MRIVVDIDDVIADSMTTFVEFYQRHYDENFKFEDIRQYEYLGFLGETKEEAEEKIFHFNNSEFFYNTKPFKEAQDAIKVLAEEHEIFALTSRPIYIERESKEWVKKHFSQIKEVWFNNSNSSSKGTLTNQKSKSEICVENGADILIEDLLKFTNDTNDKLKVFLLDRPWNQGEILPNVIRVSTWQEIIDKIHSYS